VGIGGRIYHFNGTAWSSVPSGTTDTLYGVWGSSASDVWAVGGGTKGRVLRYTGSAWTDVPSGTTKYLNAVSGASGSGPWAVGRDGVAIRWRGP
jgi:hypothetical protein